MHSSGEGLLAGLPTTPYTESSPTSKTSKPQQSTSSATSKSNMRNPANTSISCLSLHASAILDDRQTLGDIPFRFTLEGNTSLIKVIPSLITAAAPITSGKRLVAP